MSETNLWRRAARALTVLLALAAGAALGEARGDLSERFAEVPRVEYGGETYYLRSRLSAVLVAGLLPDPEDGLPRADFAALFVIDDGERRVTPIYIDGRTIVETGEDSAALREICALERDPAEGCRRMREAVDGLLGGALIEDYMGVDLDGVSGIAEFSGIEGEARERLRQLRRIAENLPSKRLNELYGAIGDCLITDMKSGAVMRLLDKAKRYEIADPVDLPVLSAEAPVPDGEQIFELVIRVFYAPELL